MIFKLKLPRFLILKLLVYIFRNIIFTVDIGWLGQSVSLFIIFKKKKELVYSVINVYTT